VPLSQAFPEALRYAAELHLKQVRKGSGVPYAAHILSVAALVLEHGGSEEEAIAALLHDAAEDCGGRAVLDEIRRRFGNRVADIVEGCTDTFDAPKPDWRPRKEAFVARLPAAPASIRLVVAADKLHNVRSILADYRILGESLWPRFTGGKDNTLWYYRAVAAALKRAGTNALVAELERKLRELPA
jgi:GTP pyrophosphokinase